MKKNKTNLPRLRLLCTCSLLILMIFGVFFTGCKEDKATSIMPPETKNAQPANLKTLANLPKKVMHLNICGNVCWGATDADGGGVDSRGSVSRMAKVLAAIDNYDPDIVTFNEICYSQYRNIRPDMIARGYGCTYASTTTGGACDNFDNSWGTGFGDAIFSKGPVPNVQQTYILPDSTGGEPRQLLCTDTKLQGVDCKVCTTHLSNNTQVRMKQVKTIANKAAAWIPNTPLIITGDFNAIPTSAEMGLMYCHSGGTGLFQEADESNVCIPYCRSGEFTYNEIKKIDYIFFSAQHFGGLTGDVKSRFPNPISDHNTFQGSALWQ